ncbi:hypothetical protein BHM03_00038663 [Ensete ventricosum]|nr:hypothetical protein BHM03_00038663 [Ensete ventricosum]
MPYRDRKPNSKPSWSSTTRSSPHDQKAENLSRTRQHDGTEASTDEAAGETKKLKGRGRGSTIGSPLVDVALHLEVAVPGAEMHGGGKHHLYVLLLLRKHPGRHGLVPALPLALPLLETLKLLSREWRRLGKRSEAKRRRLLAHNPNARVCTEPVQVGHCDLICIWAEPEAMDYSP